MTLRAAARRIATAGIVRYLVVGGFAFVVDFGLLWLLHDAAHLVLWLATGIAFLVSFFVTYTLQRFITFGSRAPHGAALIKYAALVAVNTLATIGIVDLVTWLTAWWAVGKVVATVLTTCWNYAAYRWWIFAPRHDRRAAREGDREQSPEDPIDVQ